MGSDYWLKEGKSLPCDSKTQGLPQFPEAIPAGVLRMTGVFPSITDQTTTCDRHTEPPRLWTSSAHLFQEQVFRLVFGRQEKVKSS